MRSRPDVREVSAIADWIQIVVSGPVWSPPWSTRHFSGPDSSPGMQPFDSFCRWGGEGRDSRIVGASGEEGGRNASEREDTPGH